MPAPLRKPVLIIGGSGIVGARAAQTLRRLQPQLPITIGGRDLAKASAVAEAIGSADAGAIGSADAGAIGSADAVAIDLDRPDLGQPDRDFSAVAVFVKDATLHSLDYAQARGLPYVSTSSGVTEIGPEVARFIRRPAAAPILMASQWLAGAALLPTLHFAKAFRRIEAIAIGALLDDEDMGGPAAYADYERIVTASPRTQILRDGRWVWIGGEDAAARFRSVDGTEMPAQAYSPLDVIGLAAATDARSIRLDLALGTSASRRRGEPFSTEIVIEITGERIDGSTGRDRQELVHPEGQAPLTALGIATGIERLLGLAGGPAVPPGLYLPDSLIDPAEMVRRLEAFGTLIRQV